jgi:hypothetical protein
MWLYATSVWRVAIGCGGFCVAFGGLSGLGGVFGIFVTTPAFPAKTGIFEPFIYKMHHFTKTGSGQT